MLALDILSKTQQNYTYQIVNKAHITSVSTVDKAFFVDDNYWDVEGEIYLNSSGKAGIDRNIRECKETCQGMKITFWNKYRSP